MKLTNILLTLGLVSIVGATPSISAAIIACPTTLVCDKNSNCTTKENNGFNISNATSFTGGAGTYGFIGSQAHEIWSLHNGSQPSCWYINTNGDKAAAVANTNDTYYAVGDNWLDHGDLLAWQTCPPTTYWNNIIDPHNCSFSTTKPPIAK